MDRRSFCASFTASVALTHRDFGALLAAAEPNAPPITLAEIEQIDRERILRAANQYLSEPPVTITASSSPRSKGGKHDYFSEADYWWPDPKNPDGPYVERDGYSDPHNFNDHRLALIRLSLIVPALMAAWLMTKDKRYASQAAVHLRAWFLDPATKMNPSLEYAQAVWGKTPGRSYGIIDTLHLVEVTQAALHLEPTGVMTAVEFASLRDWFAEYLLWMMASKNGQEEEAAKNNHGSCWVAQAAAYAKFTANERILALCRARFRSHLLPDQLAPYGSFPLELARTKPYSYSLFNLDVLSIVCTIASSAGNPQDNLWEFALPGGTRYKTAVDFMFPYIQDKSKWPYPKDVEYFDDLPNRQPSLLFAGLAYHEPRYIALWRTLPPDPKTAEIIRNFPVRQPVLWVRSV
jgi:alginate lyase